MSSEIEEYILLMRKDSAETIMSLDEALLLQPFYKVITKYRLNSWKKEAKKEFDKWSRYYVTYISLKG